MDGERLKEMSETGIMDIGTGEVATFDEAAKLAGGSPAGTAKRFMEKGYNPYFRREGGNGGCIVKISFANNGIRLADAVASMLSAI
ncbi:MAG: hypothetical protein IJ682_05730 [Lachnospiraceae bacterium]|nr:hypothetical protein [Lachnospiraceae bacterium]